MPPVIVRGIPFQLMHRGQKLPASSIYLESRYDPFKKNKQP